MTINYMNNTNTEIKYVDLAGLRRYLSNTKQFIKDNYVNKSHEDFLNVGTIDVGDIAAAGGVTVGRSFIVGETQDSYYFEVNPTATNGGFQIGTQTGLKYRAEGLLWGDFEVDTIQNSSTPLNNVYLNYVNIGSRGITMDFIGTSAGGVGNPYYYRYNPLTLDPGQGLLFKSHDSNNYGSYITYYFNPNGNIKANKINCSELTCKRGATLGSTTVESLTIRNAGQLITSAGLANPLTFKYKDVNNTTQSHTYRGVYDSKNSIDISSGVYYAATAATASRVKNPLTIHTPDGVITYDGSTPNVEIIVGEGGSGGSTSGSADTLIETTYARLKNLRDNSRLIPGVKYRITDYVTTATGRAANGADITSAQHKFDIIVTALTNNTLSSSANAVNVKRSFIATANLFNWEDIGNWGTASSSDVPAEISAILPADSVIAKQQGSRAVNGGDVIRVTVTGYTGDYRDPSVQEDVKGLGASLHIRSTNELLAIDYGYDKDVYYLQVPERIAANTELTIVFYIDSDVAEAIDGKAGAIADKGYWAPDYFDNSDLGAWEIKYCLDNDTNKYNWAKLDGKGVIYHMKDEFGNECPYDFKNIKYGSRYTFSCDIALDGAGGYYIDATVKSDQISWAKICHHNTIRPRYVDDSTGIHMYLPDIITDEGCEYNTFGRNCYDITLKNYCCKNSFGDYCHDNILLSRCTLNVFGNDCYNNYIGDNSSQNTFNTNCKSIWINGSYFNTFGANCNTITVNELRDDGSTYTGGLSNSSIGTGCTNLTLQSSSPKLNSYDQLQNYTIGAGLTGKIEITGDAYNRDYETKIMRNSKGEIKQYCEADLLDMTYNPGASATVTDNKIVFGNGVTATGNTMVINNAQVDGNKLIIS